MVVLQKGYSEYLNRKQVLGKCKRALGQCDHVCPTKLHCVNGMTPADIGSKIKLPLEQDQHETKCQAAMLVRNMTFSIGSSDASLITES